MIQGNVHIIIVSNQILFFSFLAHWTFRVFKIRHREKTTERVRDMLNANSSFEMNCLCKQCIEQTLFSMLRKNIIKVRSVNWIRDTVWAHSWCTSTRHTDSSFLLLWLVILYVWELDRMVGTLNTKTFRFLTETCVLFGFNVCQAVNARNYTEKKIIW